MDEREVNNNVFKWPWANGVPTEYYSKLENWPKISIVTPSFNQGNYIEETIRSVLLQNYPNLEYIIIDGGSTDQTVEIIKKYEGQITYWISEPDSGQSDAINKGLKKCTGLIFNWLNSDDYYEPYALANIAEKFIESGKDIVCAKTKVFTLTNAWYTETPVGSDFYMFSKARIDQPSTFFRFSVFNKYAPLSVDLHLVMDADLWFRYLIENGNKSIVNIDVPIVNFREHENSKTVNNRYKMVIERAKLYSQILSAFNGKSNRYTKSVELCHKSRQNIIVDGIKDFILFWMKDSIRKLKFLSFYKLLRCYFQI